MKLTGATGNSNYFEFYESDKIEPEKIYEVMTGKLAGCMFRNVIKPADCKIIARNFWDHLNLNSRADGVPGHYLGTYHYKKELPLYLSESELANKSLPGLFKDTYNVFKNILDIFSENLKNNNLDINLRPAAHDGIEACNFFMRAWKGDGKYALAPHDDSAQCTAKIQNGFEIQDVAKNAVVALNICIENEGEGQLHYWDIQPDPETQNKLGISETGYPYALDQLEPFKKIEMEVYPGDIYFFNGKNVHAVSSPNGNDSYRTTISALMGFKDDKTIIYWT